MDIDAEYRIRDQFGSQIVTMRVSNGDGFGCVEEPVSQFIWAMDYVAQESPIVDRNSSLRK